MNKNTHTKENWRKPISQEQDTVQATSRYIPVKPVTARLPCSSSTATGFLLFAGERRISPLGALILQLDRIQVHPSNLLCKLPFPLVLHPNFRHFSYSRMKSIHWSLQLTRNNLASVFRLNFTSMRDQNVSSHRTTAIDFALIASHVFMHGWARVKIVAVRRLCNDISSCRIQNYNCNQLQ